MYVCMHACILCVNVYSRDKLRPESYVSEREARLLWILDPKDNCFNLCILARTEDNAATLRSDFMVSGCGQYKCMQRYCWCALYRITLADLERWR